MKQRAEFFEALAEAWLSEVREPAAQERGLLEFETMCEALASQPGLADMLDAKTLNSASEGHLSRDARSVLALLADRGALARLATFVTKLKLLRERMGLGREATITTAAPLAPSERRSIIAELEKRFGMPVIVSERVDTSVLSGARIISGDWLLDDTAAGRLKRLRQALKQS